MDSSLLSTIPNAKRNLPERYPLRFRIVGRFSVDLSRNVVTTTKGQQGVASIYPTGLHLLPRAISFSGNLHLAAIESSVQLFSFVQFPFDHFHAFVSRWLHDVCAIPDSSLSRNFPIMFLEPTLSTSFAVKSTRSISQCFSDSVAALLYTWIFRVILYQLNREHSMKQFEIRDYGLKIIFQTFLHF